MSEPSSPRRHDSTGEQALGRQMHTLMRELFPLHRSVTGDGVRQTLRRLQELISLEIREVPTGTAVLDWEVPKEWRVREAYIQDEGGRRLVDLAASTLHVVGYSRGVRRRMTWAELEPHLHCIPEQPDWVPFRTLHFTDGWGFCVSARQLEALRAAGAEASYEVCIDAELADGSLTFGELFLPGETGEEVLVSTHVCHPSLANDNLSGVVVAAYLALWAAARQRRHGYRFLFVPATIGAITWLAHNPEAADRVRHGLVLSCLGDAGGYTYKKSRRGDAEIDRAVVVALEETGERFEVREFAPVGTDERQYCSPGFNLPVGCLVRSPPDEYPEYHSSADDLEFVQPGQLEASLDCCRTIFGILEANRRYLNQRPKGEPRLGKYGLYKGYGALPRDRRSLQLAVQWVLNLSDGEHSLLDIAERSSLGFATIRQAAERLLECELLVACEDSTR